MVRRPGLMHEKVKVPVLKNTIWALKLAWRADKKLLLSYLINLVARDVFSLYVQNILFLKVLLSALDKSTPFGEYFLTLIGFFILSVVLKALQYGSDCVHDISVKRVMKKLNNIIFDKALSVDVSCYEDPEFYDKYQRATLVISNSYFDLICWDFANIIAASVSFVLVLTTVTAIDAKYLIFLLPVILVFIIEIFKSKYVYKRDLEMTKNNRLKAYIQRTMFLRDYSKDMRTSNIFAVLINRFRAAINSNIEILKRYGLGLFIYSMVSSLFSEFIPIIGTYAYAGYQFVFKNTLTVSGFSVLFSSINSVRTATLDIADSFDEMVQMALYFQNLRDFLDYKPKILPGAKHAGEFESLEFKNVSFRYPGAAVNALSDVSFKIKKGETVAVVGVNGAGKSTIVKLLLRFYDVSEGEILLNGINVKEYDVDSLRNSFATVFQDYKNFAVSVFENVMCRECSSEDKAFATAALKKSGAWEKVKSLPHGGDTVLTREFENDGAGLSGGENQKVSAARLFARDFKIAILDEPSSALDPIAEYKMYENLIAATKDKTVVYISHRLSSAVLSDKIIVIKDGKIIEQGTHDELMKAGREYSQMFSLQGASYMAKQKEDEHIEKTKKRKSFSHV
ncbi:MAG: ABC transporter ATP-binding protein/permease [Clostridiales bacterium]|nr:ABC transporter ATP-binding protein/permease [Clostridiales bacterium]